MGKLSLLLNGCLYFKIYSRKSDTETINIFQKLNNDLLGNFKVLAFNLIEYPTYFWLLNISKQE